MTSHPVGRADRLIVDAVALVRQQRKVPVAVIRVVVSHGEGQWALNPAGRELCCEVILRVQHGCVLEVDGDWITPQNLCSSP